MPTPSRRAPETSGPSRRRPIRGEVLMDEPTAHRLRRVRLHRVFLILFVASILPVTTGLYFSPLFRVGEAEVVGANQLDAAQVRELAGLDGDSMLRLDTSGAVERIQYLPLVKSVRIERSWPNSARIIIEERHLWGYWQVGEAKYSIDGNGVVLADIAAADGAPAPTITDLTNPVRLVPGDRVDGEAVALAALLVARTPQVLSWSPAGFEFSADKGLALISDTGYRVVIGDSQNIEYKLAVWKKIEEELGRAAMSGHVLDLRFENRPAFQ